MMGGRALLPLCLVAIVVAFFAYVQHIMTAQPIISGQPSGFTPTPPSAASYQRQQQIAAMQYARQNDWAPKMSVQQGIVQIRFHSVNYPTADAPLTALVIATKSYPKLNVFRMTWKWYGKDAQSKSTVWYYRQKHILRFYCGGYDEGRFIKRTVFQGVSDALLRRDAVEHEKPNARYTETEIVSLAFFDDLLRYGCIGHDLPPTDSLPWVWQNGLWCVPP